MNFQKWLWFNYSINYDDNHKWYIRANIILNDIEILGYYVKYLKEKNIILNNVIGFENVMDYLQGLENNNQHKMAL
jgi:hypothetical protein